jgi:hypothetical protein
MLAAAMKLTLTRLAAIIIIDACRCTKEMITHFAATAARAIWLYEVIRPLYLFHIRKCN